MTSRVTQDDVARALGVHRTTVCLALKGHRSIPKTTREKVEAMARKLGYMPDPMLSALAAYRDRQRNHAFHGSICWLANDQKHYAWQQIPSYHEYYEGAMSKGRAHGYNIEIFDINDPSISRERLVSILHARNISGILVGPQPGPNTVLDFPWDEFSAVAFGYSVASPLLHRVTSSQFRCIVQTLTQMRAKGYERIAFTLSKIHDKRTAHYYLGAYMAEQKAAGRPILIPPDVEIERDPQMLKEWLLKNRADALITGDASTLEKLTEVGLKVPEDIGIAWPGLPNKTMNLSGMYECSREIGEAAVDLLAAMIMTGEKGVPLRARHIYLDGEWVEGKTLR